MVNLFVSLVVYHLLALAEGRAVSFALQQNNLLFFVHVYYVARHKSYFINTLHDLLS